MGRLRQFLAQLSPSAQAMLVREFERAAAGGGDDAQLANLVLGELRQLLRKSNVNARSRKNDAQRDVFRALEPFLVDRDNLSCPGEVRRSSLEAVWQWLAHEALVEETKALEVVLAEAEQNGPTVQAAQALSAYRVAAGEAVSAVIGALAGRDGDRRRNLTRLSSPRVIEDLPAIAALLRAHEALANLADRLPPSISTFGASQVANVAAALDLPMLQNPVVLPFALSLAMSRLDAPWQIIRLPIQMAGSDDEVRVAALPYGVAVTMALHDLSRRTAALGTDIKRGRFKLVGENLKTIHDGVRGLRTELDLRSDSSWGRQLAAIRKDISGGLRAEIESVPGRVRRLLRQRPESEITATSSIDAMEVDETAALIGFLAECRAFAGELAISEVSQRAFSELQQYVERATAALLESVKVGQPRSRAYRQRQVEVAIRFCSMLFGNDYAVMMARAAEHAVADAKRAAQAKSG